MGRLAKLKREIIAEANKRILNEQGIDPKEYPLHRDNKMVNTGETTTSLETKVSLSKEETKELEEKINQLIVSIEKAKSNKKLKKDMLDELRYNLRSNKILKKVLKRKEKQLEKELKKIENLENVDPDKREEHSKQIAGVIAGIIASGLGSLVIDSKSPNPLWPRLVDKFHNTVRRFTSGG